jgi:hypothetical protein
MMRNIFKDITLTIDGNQQGFRLTMLDAFYGVESFLRVERFFESEELRVESGDICGLLRRILRS